VTIEAVAETVMETIPAVIAEMTVARGATVQRKKMLVSWSE